MASHPVLDFEMLSKEGTRLAIHKSHLLKSDVFAGMLSCCDGRVDQLPVLELDESEDDLHLLLTLLQQPPSPPTLCLPKREESVRYLSAPEYYPHSQIPLPIIPRLFHLVDKYALDGIYPVLCAHLEAYVGTMPLFVYGYASSHDMAALAITASQYLLHPPLSTYDAKDTSQVPDEAYQRLVSLHELRVKLLRELIAHEKPFPFDYGICTRYGHAKKIRTVWDKLAHDLSERVDAGSDAAAEMEVIYETSKPCPMCHRACEAAVDMLRYKSRRSLPKRIDELPQ